MNTLTIVAGPPCSGKSTYIKNSRELSKKTVVDLYDFQRNHMSLSEVQESYALCYREVAKQLNNGKDVVLEHTFLKAQRRKEFLEFLRERYTGDVHMVYFHTPTEVLTERIKKRGIAKGKEKELAESFLSQTELPTYEEGYKTLVFLVN